MKRLDSLIQAVNLIDSIGSLAIQVSSLALDSRLVQKDGLFAATRGSNTDGHLFIDKAINDYIFPKQKDKLTRLIKLQIQIVCITLLAVFLRSQVVPVSVPGNGILYAFAFMFAQDNSKYT